MVQKQEEFFNSEYRNGILITERTCNPFSFLDDFVVPINSGKYRPWMLANIPFCRCTCIRPGVFYRSAE